MIPGLSLYIGPLDKACQVLADTTLFGCRALTVCLSVSRVYYVLSCWCVLLAWPGGLLASVSAQSVDESFWETFKQKLIEQGCDEAATGFVRLVLAQRRILNAETFCHVVVNEQFKFIPEACFLARLLGTILYVAIHEQMSVYDECVVSLSDSLSLSLSLFPYLSLSLFIFSSFLSCSLSLSLASCASCVVLCCAGNSCIGRQNVLQCIHPGDCWQ